MRLWRDTETVPMAHQVQGHRKVVDWRGGEGRRGFRKRADGLTIPGSKRRGSEASSFPGLLLVMGFLLFLL